MAAYFAEKRNDDADLADLIEMLELGREALEEELWAEIEQIEEANADDSDDPTHVDYVSPDQAVFDRYFRR